MKHSKLLLFSIIVNSLLIASSLPIMAEPGMGLPDEISLVGYNNIFPK